MCGIALCIGDTRVSVIESMVKRLAHRGPDGQRHRIGDWYAMGHSRLSVIDAFGGAQPMADSTATQWLSCNGEIYGYRALRDQLGTGYSFATHSDTETLFPLYANHGLRFVEQLNGMFAFCLIDEARGRCIICRDHFGVKPLVYTIVNNHFYAASEVKAFYAIPEWTASPDMASWNAFFNIRFTPSPGTLFKDVKKISPATYLILQRSSDFSDVPANHRLAGTMRFGDWYGQMHTYYRIPKISSCRAKPDEGLMSTLSTVLDEQVIADTDVGIYLSGGVDSTCIAALASRHNKKIRTFCLGFGEPTDENQRASAIALELGADHHDVRLNDRPLDNFKRAVFYMEEPKVNCLQGFLLAREARKYQTVVLSGLGGDELFGGYDVYALALMLDVVRRGGAAGIGSAVGRAAGALLSCIPGLHTDLARRGAALLQAKDSALRCWLLLRNSWDHDRRLCRAIYKKNMLEHDAIPMLDFFADRFPRTDLFIDGFMQFEFANKMVDDFLCNEDRMSMAWGLESRVPMLDRRLVEFAFTLPLDQKISLWQRKIILRRMLRHRLGNLPVAQGKHGFTFNPVIQFTKDLKPFAQRYLTRERIEASGIFNYRFVKRVIDSNPSPLLRWHYFMLWQIIGYHVWEDIFILGRGTDAD